MEVSTESTDASNQVPSTKIRGFSDKKGKEKKLENLEYDPLPPLTEFQVHELIGQCGRDCTLKSVGGGCLFAIVPAVIGKTRTSLVDELIMECR